MPTWNGKLTAGLLIGSWKYIGCQSEIQGRVLRGSSYSDNKKMTIESCMDYCSKANFGLAGLEYGEQCYCANAASTDNPALNKAPSCDMGCKGATGQMCGGVNAVSLFNNTAYKPPANLAKVGGWSYVSCFMEPQAVRALPEASMVDDAMTVEKCIDFCGKTPGKYDYAGVELGRECWCSKKMTPNLEDASDPSCRMQCDMACGGNKQQKCGGWGTINIYKAAGVKRRHEDGNLHHHDANGKPSSGVFARNGRFVKVVRKAAANAA